MHFSADSVPDRQELTAQVVIVGAGPAGIVTALELADHGIDVLLIESGGWGRDSGLGEDLSEAELGDARRHAPMSIATQRRVGGTSTIWGGRCVPYDPVDFDDRPYVKDSNWPIAYSEVSAFHRRACEYFRCGAPIFDASEVPAIADRLLAPRLTNGEVRATDLERWSLPTNFGQEYKTRLKSHRSLRLVSHLVCVEAMSEPSRTAVGYLRCVNRAGRELRVRGEHYVLAAGGLGTTRILLNSDRLHPGGLGDHSGHLGRWYMAHVDGRIAKIKFAGDPRDTIFAHERDADGVYVRRRLSFSRDAIHKYELPNIVAWSVNPDLFDASHHSGVLSFAYLALTSPLGHRFAPEAIRRALTDGRASRRSAHLRNVLSDPLDTAWFAVRFGYQRFLARRRAPGFFVCAPDNTYPLHYHSEHFPNAESRVTLSKDSDHVGMRRLHVDIRFSDQDARGVVRAHELWDAYLQRCGAGCLVFEAGDLARLVAEQTEGGFHQIGTTRMSRHAADGVLTPDLLVHGTSNLSVVSSSAFCSAGQANSTFLAVAFALRCADELRRRLADPHAAGLRR